MQPARLSAFPARPTSHAPHRRQQRPQRHSDHHYKPDRRSPLLQSHAEDAAPQLPYGYPVMTALAMVPPLWKRVMNKRVRAWRKQNYPDITDCKAYNKGTHVVG